MPTTSSRTLLGDKITAALEALGARRVVDAVGWDCGCENRRKWLNDLDGKLFDKDYLNAMSATNGSAAAVLSEEE